MLRTRVGPGNHVLDGGPNPPWKGAILRAEGASHCKIYGHSAVISAKTAEPIEMPFGLWAGMGPRNHVLDGSSQVLRDVAWVTNLGTQFAISGFLAFDEL